MKEKMKYRQLFSLIGVLLCLSAVGGGITSADQCVPQSSVLCLVVGFPPCESAAEENTFTNGDFVVSTSIDANLKVFVYPPLTDQAGHCSFDATQKASAHKNALAFANQLKSAGVCKFVVDQSD